MAPQPYTRLSTRLVGEKKGGRLHELALHPQTRVVLPQTMPCCLLRAQPTMAWTGVFTLLCQLPLPFPPHLGMQAHIASRCTDTLAVVGEQGHRFSFDFRCIHLAFGCHQSTPPRPIFPRVSRCPLLLNHNRVHKTANVLDKLPKDLQVQAKQRLQAIWMAPDRQRAEMAFDLFIATYEGKYPQAAECRVQDHEVLLAFYNFPADIPHLSLRFASFLYSLEVVYHLLTIRGDCYARPSPVPSSSLGSPRPCRRHVRRTGPFGDGLDHATRQNPEMRDLTVGAAVKAMVFNGLGLPCS